MLNQLYSLTIYTYTYLNFTVKLFCKYVFNPSWFSTWYSLESSEMGVLTEGLPRWASGHVCEGLSWFLLAGGGTSPLWEAQFPGQVAWAAGESELTINLNWSLTDILHILLGWKLVTWLEVMLCGIASLPAFKLMLNLLLQIPLMMTVAWMCKHNKSFLSIGYFQSWYLSQQRMKL